MEFKKIDDIIIEGAHLVFKNFSGNADKYNRAGNRSFAVVISERSLAGKLMEDGWNVRQFRPRDPDEEPDYYLPVAVSFDYYPPHIVVMSKKTRVELDEELVGNLDHMDIANVDLKIRPYSWEVNGKTGVKAYLKDMYVTLVDDPLAEKYSNIGLGDEEAPPFN